MAEFSLLWRKLIQFQQASDMWVQMAGLDKPVQMQRIVRELLLAYASCITSPAKPSELH